MSKDSKVPMGSLVVDARALADFIVDLEHGRRQGMRTEQKGYADVVNEIVSNQREYGEKAGITQTNFERLLELNRQIEQIDQVLPAALKLVELLTETRAAVDDERQRLVSAFGQSVEYSAKASRDTGLLAKYEKTRSYRSAIAKKGVRTRQRNAVLAAEADESVQKAEG